MDGDYDTAAARLLSVNAAVLPAATRPPLDLDQCAACSPGGVEVAWQQASIGRYSNSSAVVVVLEDDLVVEIVASTR